VTEWGRQVHSGCGNSENSELPTSGSTPTICRSSPSSAFASLLAHHLSRSLQHPPCRSLFALLHVHMPARAHTPTIAPRFSLHSPDALSSSFHRSDFFASPSLGRILADSYDSRGWRVASSGRSPSGPVATRSRARARHASLREIGRLLSSASRPTHCPKSRCESGVTSCLVRHHVGDNGDNDVNGESSMLNYGASRSLDLPEA